MRWNYNLNIFIGFVWVVNWCRLQIRRIRFVILGGIQSEPAIGKCLRFVSLVRSLARSFTPTSLRRQNEHETHLPRKWSKLNDNRRKYSVYLKLRPFLSLYLCRVIEMCIVSHIWSKNQLWWERFGAYISTQTTRWSQNRTEKKINQTQKEMQIQMSHFLCGCSFCLKCSDSKSLLINRLA